MPKKGPKFQRLDGPRHVDNTQGSPLWQYNHFRTSIITSLLNDLVDLENEGMAEDICKQIQKSLRYFVAASTEVSTGGFLSGGPLYVEIQQFLDTYVEWNDINGRTLENSKQRRKKLSVLLKKRQDITDKVRRLQFELQNDLDQKILADSYNAIGELINIVPGMFRNLTSSFGQYTKRVAFTA